MAAWPTRTGEKKSMKKDSQEKVESELKILVRTFYDFQNLRINLGGRINEKGKTMLTLSPKAKERFELNFKELKSWEGKCLRDIKKILEGYPIWTEYLSAVKGIGPTMAGMLITEIEGEDKPENNPTGPGILRFRSVSALWSYAGYGLKDGEIQRRKKGEKLNYNAFMKTKLRVVAESFIKSSNETYRKLYDNYKHRLQSRPCTKPPEKHNKKKDVDDMGCTDGHRHSMSLRYIVKIFLKDLYLKWWELEGKVPRPSYQEEYLGHKHKEKAA